MTPTPNNQLGLPLDASSRPWPPQERFPHNFAGETVERRIVADIVESSAPLLVTGYAGLEQLLGLFHRCLASDGPAPLSVRLLVGVEPTPTSAERRRRPTLPLEDAIAEFWLKRGISLLNSRELLSTLRLIEEGVLTVRSSGASRVHAKIYVGDAAVTLGSSNFTRPGLVTNLEANARFAADDEEPRYREAANLAENLWQQGRDYTQGFRVLLEQLLQNVTWQEALARACSELLEGEWAPLDDSGLAARRALWPSQEQGIAQALWVLENHGAVLVADATGSGKTRMGAHLLRCLQDRNWRLGRSRMRYPVVICPPAVEQLWATELADAAESVQVFSHGILSRSGSDRHVAVEKALRQSRALTVDEAHNFLNRLSQRSRMLYGNVADNVILLTATPINRGPQDLLAIVELLGADNFEDEVLRVVARLARAGRRSKATPLKAEETTRLRSALQEFVVRRTKADFNRLVDRDADRYLNALGRPCRYPEHDPVVFPREDPPDDCGRALAIRVKAKSLRGLIWFRKELRMPGFLRMEGWTEERFLRMRIKGASALAGYYVRSRLRSSKVALVEHLLGTAEASRRFELGRAKASASGAVLRTLEKIAGKPPTSALGVPLPPWLEDPAEHRRAAEEEMEIYRDILRQTEQMSEHRMEANAEYLLSLLADHHRVLAFDSHLISLHDLRKRLEARGAHDVVLATGEGGMASRRTFSRRFALDATDEGVIGLCSDALAEGLNLQGASAIVHLDLPSVIRIMEQRIGRVDRMDSPHARVAVHWPDEPAAFGLRSDERLFRRLRDVEDLLGSNVPIPAEFEGYEPDHGEHVTVGEIIEAVEREKLPDAVMTLADAFARVRGLVDGPEALVKVEVYEALRAARTKVLSSVAVVPAKDAPWAFLAVGASDRTVPRWVLVENGEVERVEGTLDEVAAALRARLAPGPEDVPFDEGAARVLESAIGIAERHQGELLSRRKRRALEELEFVTKQYRRAAEGAGDTRRLSVTREILELLHTPQGEHTVELGRLADWWLQLIRDEWYEHLTKKGARRPARLRHLRRRLKEEPIATEDLETIRRVELVGEPLERRIVAAIVGVGEGGAGA